MTKYTYEPYTDPTMDAVERAIESEQTPRSSKNIGFGAIGHECNRKLWYDINMDIPEVFESSTLRIFRNGHADEAAMADDLRKVDGIQLWTHDPNRDNKQYKFDALGGRLTGRLDGVIKGLKQAPATPHIWEHKSVNQKKFDKFLALRDECGEKTALFQWDIVYYGQAQMNMRCSKLPRHYLTVSTPGLRQVASCRTEYDSQYAKNLEDKAEVIINATSPPPRISSKKEMPPCRRCRWKTECHG